MINNNQITIDQLPPIAVANAGHVLPAMLGGETGGLIVGAIADLIIAQIEAGAPAALDTLKELADAIGNDASFAATMTAALGARLQKAQNLADLADKAAARGNLNALAYVAQALNEAQKGQALANLSARRRLSRNWLDNANFDVWQRGTGLSMSGSSGSNTLGRLFQADCWGNFIQSPNPGTGNNAITVSRQTFPLGQTDVPGDPKYFHRLSVDGVQSGATNSFVATIAAIESVATDAGGFCTVTFWAKSNVATTIGLAMQQHFGSGGTPSTPVTFTPVGAGTRAIGTGWTKVQATFNIPPISGKILGTSGNDSLRIVIIWAQQSGTALGNSYGALGTWGARTYDLAHASAVPGDATAESDPSPAEDPSETQCRCHRRYFRWDTQVINYGFTVRSDTVLANRYWRISFPTAMRAIPTALPNITLTEDMLGTMAMTTVDAIFRTNGGVAASSLVVVTPPSSVDFEAELA